MAFLETYWDIGELFEYKWDPGILAALAEDPRRWAQVRNKVDAIGNQRVENNALKRSLDRLEEDEMLHKAETRVKGRTVHVYSITAQGRRYLEQYEVLFAAWGQVKHPTTPCQGCCLHSLLRRRHRPERRGT